LHELRNCTNIDFPKLYGRVCELVVANEANLKAILATFNFESAMKYNQEKRRLFKDSIFGQLVMDIPDEDIEVLKARATCVDNA
jgi:hypothetical protein